ncbi:hypothetical protein AB0O91_09910 [Kitasatospora sp. NPDC089797]|uniref:hypothetical protein n=1 Tax=Kitasatospora sp. NPDC089797 TaxID=3155298 RepID=UPI00342D26F7
MTAPLSSPEPGRAHAHPTVEKLADLAEGLVEPAAAADALHRHLAGCAECRETVDALAEVQALLGAVEPEPMPADIAARLTAALAEEAHATADHTAEHAESHAEEHAPENAPEGPRGAPAAAHRSATPGPAARSLQAPSTPSAPPSRPAAASGPGRARPRRRRFALLLGTAAALAAVGLGGALLLNRSDDSGSATASAVSTASATGAPDVRAPQSAGPGTVYQEDRLAAQVRQLLTRAGAEPGLRATGPAKSDAAPADGARPEFSGPGTPASTPGTPPPACGAPAPGTPLATDRGSYQGSPVDVLVYPAPGRPGFVDVYLRSPDCGPVLLHRTVPGN